MPGLYVSDAGTVADPLALSLLFPPAQHGRMVVAVQWADTIIRAVMTSSRP